MFDVEIYSLNMYRMNNHANIQVFESVVAKNAIAILAESWNAQFY